MLAPREQSAPLGAPGSTCDDEHCITCGDVAVPLRVVRTDSERALALCESERGECETVETALVGAVAVGDRVLVHAGVALTLLEDE